MLTTSCIILTTSTSINVLYSYHYNLVYFLTRLYIEKEIYTEM